MLGLLRVLGKCHTYDVSMQKMQFNNWICKTDFSTTQKVGNLYGGPVPLSRPSIDADIRKGDRYWMKSKDIHP